MIKNQETILFQGDSITDCRRDREVGGTPNDLHSLGKGYAMMASAQILSARPGADLKFFNRGISGNRVVDLSARVKSDLINLAPDVVSILIGVNDTWHGQRHQNGVTVPKYERVYRELLAEVREALPRVRFVLCEPFVLQCGVVSDDWIVEIDQRRAVVAGLAREFEATFIPFQSIFDECVTLASPSYWAADGVHPSAAGHLRMANAWVKHMNALDIPQDRISSEDAERPSPLRVAS